MAKIITLDMGGHTIETWYDRHTRSWISQLKDPNGAQLGDAEYAGTKAGIAIGVELLQRQFHQLKLERCERHHQLLSLSMTFIKTL